VHPNSSLEHLNFHLQPQNVTPQILSGTLSLCSPALRLTRYRALFLLLRRLPTKTVLYSSKFASPSKNTSHPKVLKLPCPLTFREPYLFKADGTFTEMDIDESFNFKKLFGKFGTAMNKIQDFLNDDK
jgi:hypothetical protein